MEADIRWLDDPQVFRVGQLPAHSDHPIYQDTEEAAEGRSSLVQSLDGTWEFAYSVNAKSRPVDFTGKCRQCTVRYDLCAGTY